MRRVATVHNVKSTLSSMKSPFLYKPTLARQLNFSLTSLCANYDHLYITGKTICVCKGFWNRRKIPFFFLRRINSMFDTLRPVDLNERGVQWQLFYMSKVVYYLVDLKLIKFNFKSDNTPQWPCVGKGYPLRYCRCNSLISRERSIVVRAFVHPPEHNAWYPMG